MHYWVLLFPSFVFSAPKCALPDSSSDWYRAITFCASTPFAKPSEFTGCLSTLPGSGQPTVEMGALLVAGFTNIHTADDLPSACLKCAYSFALDVKAAYEVDSTEWLSACTFGAAYTADSVKSSACQWRMYHAITAFNTCAGNGYDIVTKAASTRCTTSEFRNFAISHNPIAAITQCAYGDTSLLSAREIARCVGSQYVANKASLGCVSCFDSLMTSIRSYSQSCEDNNEFSFGACDSTAVLEAFGSCSGGMTFSTQIESHCTESEMRLITAMRPYSAMANCAGKPAGGTCLLYYNSVTSTLSRSCMSYFNRYLVESIPIECTTDPFASACTHTIRDIYGPLYTVEVGTGMVIDTRTTQCSHAQWDAIPKVSKSYIPFIRCAMNNSSPSAVLDCVGLQIDVPCSSCFEQLAVEAFLARNDDPLADVLCIDLYSIGCLRAMYKPIDIFRNCAGYSALNLSTGECTPDAREELENAHAGIDQIVELVSTSLTVTEAIYRYSQISDTFPCMYCYRDLIPSLFALSSEGKSACVADINSWSCYMALGAHVDNFWKCSRGWELPVTLPDRPKFDANLPQTPFPYNFN